MLRHSPKGNSPGHQGHVWPITCPRSWDRLTERRIPPTQPPVSPVSRLALHRECRWWAAVTATPFGSPLMVSIMVKVNSTVLVSSPFLLYSRCHLCVCGEEITVTQQVGCWSKTAFCIHINRCRDGKLSGTHYRSAILFAGRWRSRRWLHFGTSGAVNTTHLNITTRQAPLSLNATPPSLPQALLLSLLLVLSLLLLLLEGCPVSLASDASTIATRQSLAASRGCTREGASATSAWNEASESTRLTLATISTDGGTKRGPSGHSICFLAIAPFHLLEGLYSSTLC